MAEETRSSKQVVAMNKPIKVDLKKGETYYWCRCGRSKNQPFCDGSHRVTTLKPIKFTAKEDGEKWLCRCKQTHNQPFCDGHHAKVSDDKVGKEFVLDDFNDESKVEKRVGKQVEETVEEEIKDNLEPDMPE